MKQAVNRIEKLAEFVWKRAKIIIIATAIIIITALLSFFNFSFDLNILSSFNEGNEASEEYSALVAKYSSG